MLPSMRCGKNQPSFGSQTKDKRKTAALRLLKKPLGEIECVEAENWRREQQQLTTTTTDNPLQLCIDNFSFEELHHVMMRNGSQILGLFDENEYNVLSTRSLQAVWFCNGSQDTHYTEWWKLLVKKLQKLHSINETNSIQHVWLYTAILCKKRCFFLMMLMVSMIDSFLCSLHKEMYSSMNSSCLFPQTFHH